MTPAQEQIIQVISDRVEIEMSGEGTGHDWWHVYRVWKLAARIGRAEGADFYATSLGALLHDIADWKFNGGDHQAGPRRAREIMEEAGVDQPTVETVCETVANVSYSKGAVPKTLEGQCVQDADRLEVLGAIGVARAFAYGGHVGQPIHDPDLPPDLEGSRGKLPDRSTGTTINHFYEKVLQVKDQMNTATGRNLAEARHQYVEQYLERFFREWEGQE